MSSLPKEKASAFGTIVTLFASQSFPNAGINLSSFADDTDPFDVQPLTVAQVAKNVNGTMVYWANAEPINQSINLIAGADDDVSMQFLLAANTPVYGKQLANDIIRIVVLWPNGETRTYNDGVIISGSAGYSISSGQRIKTNSYALAFSSMTMG